jgi:MFS superfamily sulfate permease-like transporter
VVGLYAAVPALVLYALAGSSRQLVVGAMSATAALSAAINMPLADGDTSRYIALSTALAICTGLAGLVAALLRLGFVASFISEPVLKGFIVGLALTITIGQVPKLLGIEKTPGDFFEQTWGVITHLNETDGLTLLIGASSLILVLALKRWLPLIPGSLVVVLLGILAVNVFGLDEKGVKIVGHIDRQHRLRTFVRPGGQRQPVENGRERRRRGEDPGQRSRGRSTGDHHPLVPDRVVRVTPGDDAGCCGDRCGDRARRHRKPAAAV